MGCIIAGYSAKLIPSCKASEATLTCFVSACVLKCTDSMLLIGTESDALPFVLDSEPAPSLGRQSSGLSPPAVTEAVSAAGSLLHLACHGLMQCGLQTQKSCVPFCTFAYIVMLQGR